MPSHAGDPSSSSRKSTKVEYRFSAGFAEFLRAHNASLVVSTYQAGQLATIGTSGDDLVVDFESFDRPMGIAFEAGWLAVATRRQVWFLLANESIAGELEPCGQYQLAFLPRHSNWTSDIQAHELCWANGELVVVNTLFSCLCTLSQTFNFIPQWQPPFVTRLAAEDRCHLNGVAMANGSPVFATCLGISDVAGGWRPEKATAGALLSVPEGEPVLGGLCMPHSPRIHLGDVWLLNSGMGQLLRFHPDTGLADLVATFPGYTRGLALFGKYAFVGLSRIRETVVFGGIPLAAYHDQLKCGVAIVDLARGVIVAEFEFVSGVEEVFDVLIVPNVRSVNLASPMPEDKESTIWLVPTPKTSQP